MGMKIYTNELGHMIKLAVCPYMVRPLTKIFSSRTERPMALELGMQHWEPEYYQDYSNGDLGLTLTFFTARSNMGKKLIHRISCFEDFA